MSSALFPGSFDPITNGHVDIVRQAARIFDKVYVVVMTNTSKRYLFTVDERVELVKDALKKQQNVEVLKKPDKLTVQVAHELNVNAIVRGVRNTEDFLYEQQIAAMNQDLAEDVETVVLFTKPQDSFVASSIIKEVAQFNGNIGAFLPEKVAVALKEKLGNGQ